MGTQNNRHGLVRNLNNIERERVRIQKELDERNTPLRRRKLGQFATPYSLAKEVVAFALDKMHTGPIEFLEPALGTGAFFSALLDSAETGQLVSAVGYEVDPIVAKVANQLWNDVISLSVSDFTYADPNRQQVNLLITNPPYVRHHLISKDDKEYLQAKAKRITGRSLSGLTGLYCYFMLIAHQWLKPDAISAWLIPSEFMDVNYGSEIKKYLLEDVELLLIHRYDPQNGLFDDALVSSCVVWFRNRKRMDDYEVEFSFGGTHSNPLITRSVSKSILLKERKWTRFPQKEERDSELITPKLNELFSIKRGIATGDNQFFIVDKGTIEEFGLNQEYLQPILPSPRCLAVDVINGDENGDPVIEKTQYLINCQLSEAAIQEKHPELWEYLQKGIGTTSEKYLCRYRKRWYFQEHRDPAPILCTYMGRNVMNSNIPFHFILNNSNAIATNSYLLLYPKEAVRKKIVETPHLLDQIWNYLNSLSSGDLENESRVYGGGLRKIEPSELGNVHCSGLEKLIFGNNRRLEKSEQLQMDFS